MRAPASIPTLLVATALTLSVAARLVAVEGTAGVDGAPVDAAGPGEAPDDDPATGDEVDREDGGDDGDDRDAAERSEKPTARPDDDKPGAAKRELPLTVPLPAEGSYPAATVVRGLEKLTGRRVVFAHSDLAKRQVRITLEMSRRDSTAEALRILLGAHGLFVHEHFLPDPHLERPREHGDDSRRDAPGGESSEADFDVSGERVWIVSADPRWRERTDRRFSRIFTVPPKLFRKSVDSLSRYVATLPATPPDRPDLETVIIPVWRAGKILARSPSPRVLRVMERLLSPDHGAGDAAEDGGQESRDKPAPRPRLLSYVPQHYPASELRERVLRYLSEAETRQVHIVPSGLRNLLLVRARPKLLEKIRKVLPFADNPKLDPERSGGLEEPVERPVETRKTRRNESQRS